jgi:hypothetical protein
MSSNKVRVGPAADVVGRDLARLLNEWLETHGAVGIMKTCASCHFMTPREEPAFCTKYNLTPPAFVIVQGCPTHTDKEEVPF